MIRIENPSEELMRKSAEGTELVVNSNFVETLDPRVGVVDNTKIVAKAPIKKGTIVYRGSPLLFYNKVSDSSCGLLCSLYTMHRKKLDELALLVKDLYPRTPLERAELLYASVPSLRKEDYWIFSSTEYWIESVATANKYSSGDKYVVYCAGSKFNHSCYPNCIDMINREGYTLVVMAAKDIDAGEECNISYNHSLMNIQCREQRRSTLMKDLHFHCCCDYCENDVPLPGLDTLYISCIETGRVSACFSCNIVNITQRCSRCKKASYCNRACQLKHWTVHKSLCK